jgi:hypothetical protein
VIALLFLIGLPLAVALGGLHRPTWYPTDDLAQTELQVRDVGAGHPPMVGLAGRIGTLAKQGSHPGPLSFWALWPFYELFGAHSWGLQAASVALHVLAAGGALWIALRRGGLRLALGIGVVLALLVRAYGTTTLTEAWNPYLPVMWWMVFLLAVWSVVSDDLPMLVVAVAAGSFCMQTHLPYLGIGGALLAGAVLYAFGRAYTARGRDPRAVRRVVQWTLVAAAAGVFLWLPPLIEEVIHRPGNLSAVHNEMLHPPESPIGARRGLEVLLVHLNPWKIVAKQTRATTGALLPGAALLVAWAAAVVVALRLRARALVRLDAVLAAALVLALVSLSRIIGIVWYYLMLWAWGVTALMVLAIGWAVALVVQRRVRADATLTTLTRVAGVALAGIVVASTAAFSVDAARAELPSPRLSATLGLLVPDTARALAARARGAPHERYLVTWTDPLSIGAQGFGLLNELERRGFDVGAQHIYTAGVRSHRVLDPRRASAEVHLSVGTDIDEWRGRPGVRLVAYSDPRTPAQRAEYRRLRREVIAALGAEGLAPLVPAVDRSLFTTAIDLRVSERARRKMVRMTEIGLPRAVFIGPPRMR